MPQRRQLRPPRRQRRKVQLCQSHARAFGPLRQHLAPGIDHHLRHCAVAVEHQIVARLHRDLHGPRHRGNGWRHGHAGGDVKGAVFVGFVAAVDAEDAALFATAGQLLGELAGLDSDSALRYRLRRYAAPDLLLIDEVGYLSYSNRHADLLFELINRRHEKKSTLITTNKAFSEWGEVFPNASCVVAMIDRLVHHAEILSIKGESFRRKEAQEAAAAKSKTRKTKGGS